MDTQDGKWMRAELYYKKVLSLNPKFASAYSNLGYIYFVNGQFTKAKEYFSRALILNPMLTDIRLNLVRVFLKESDYKKAIELCLQNLNFVNDDTGSLFILLRIYIQKNDLVSIKKYAYRIINTQDDPQVLTRLGNILAQKGFFDIALDGYIKAIRVAPDYTDAYLNAGILLGNRGDYKEAIHIWKLGSSLKLSDPRFKTDISKAEELLLSNQ